MNILLSLLFLLSLAAFVSSLVAIEVSYRTVVSQHCPRWAAGLSFGFMILSFSEIISPQQLPEVTTRHISWFVVCLGAMIMVILSNRAHIMRTKLLRTLAKRRQEKNARRTSAKNGHANFTGKSVG